MLAALLTACVGGTEPPEIIVLPQSFGIEASDSLWMPCEAVDAQQDSAFHFVSSTTSYLDLGPGDSASVHVWIEDVNRNLVAIPLRCQGTVGSGGGTERTGTFDATSAGIAFAWDMVPAPDTVGFWVTSEEVSLGPAFRPTSGDAWTGSLTIEGHILQVLLHPR